MPKDNIHFLARVPLKTNFHIKIKNYEGDIN